MGPIPQVRKPKQSGSKKQTTEILNSSERRIKNCTGINGYIDICMYLYMITYIGICYMFHFSNIYLNRNDIVATVKKYIVIYNNS